VVGVERVWQDGRLGYLHPEDGRFASSVTSVIMGGSTSYESEAMAAGTALHQAVEAMLLTDIAPEGLDPGFAFRVAQSMQLLGARAVATEQTVWGGAPPFEFCGTADARMEISGTEVIFDLKTGLVDPPPHTYLQLGAYASAHTWLMPDGSTSPVETCQTGAIWHIPRSGLGWTVKFVDAERAARSFEQRLTEPAERIRLRGRDYLLLTVSMREAGDNLPELVVIRPEAGPDERFPPCLEVLLESLDERLMDLPQELWPTERFRDNGDRLESRIRRLVGTREDDVEEWLDDEAWPEVDWQDLDPAPAPSELSDDDWNRRFSAPARDPAVRHEPAPADGARWHVTFALLSGAKREALAALPIPSSSYPAWHADPLGEWPERFYDGDVWTERVRRPR
jgi:hypothetical protein